MRLKHRYICIDIKYAVKQKLFNKFRKSTKNGCKFL